MAGQFKKAYLQRPIKILHFLTLARIQKCLISPQQIVYVANRCIRESRRLISDFLDVTEKFKTKSYLVTVDIIKSL